MVHRLLVAYDGSDHAERALSDAVALAQENRGRLTVLAVAPEPSVWAFSGYGVPVDIDGLSGQIERACAAMLGSVSHHVLQGSRLPVLVVHGSTSPRRMA